MRIAMLTWESLHSIAVGGVAPHVSELSTALARQGHDLHVLTRLGVGQRHYEQIDGVHYHRCSVSPAADFVDEINGMCRTFVDRFFWLEDYVGHIDLVHAHDWLTANALIWIKQGRRHPAVLTMHSTEYGRCGNGFPGGRSARVRAQERAGTYWADQVIAVSGAMRNEIEWMYEVPRSKIEVVYNGVTPDRFRVESDLGEVRSRYDIGADVPTVLFCGRLALQKGPDLLMEAIPELLRRFERARFVFAGEGEMRGPLTARAQQLGVAPAVRMLGFRSGAELAELYGIADVVCIPSRNEPFGIVILEAWSAGKPVVVTRNGGPNEYVSHGTDGLKVDPDPDSISRQLSSLMLDTERARQMGANGRQTVEASFTWDKIAQKTVEAYARLLDTGRSTEGFSPAFKRPRPAAVERTATVTRGRPRRRYAHGRRDSLASPIPL